MDEIELSVLIPTYNQERYIVTALDSVLAQKTKYKYEILVGEDVSTDSTRAVLKEYESAHPQRIKVYYREVNLGCSNAPLDNHMDLYNRARGKYVIFLEGDDYWLDENKVSAQIDFLENNPEYIAVAHNCTVVDENGRKKDESYIECKDTEYTLKHYLCNILPGQLATVMMRNIYKIDGFPTYLWEKRLVPGDRLFYFTLLAHGKIHCIQRPMSAYRHILSGGSSFSANYRYNFFNDEYWHKELCNYARSVSEKSFILCAETLYLACLIRGILFKAIDFKKFCGCFSAINNKAGVLKNFIFVYAPATYKAALKFLIKYKKKGC